MDRADLPENSEYSDFIESDPNSFSREFHINESTVNKGVGQAQLPQPSTNGIGFKESNNKY